MASNINTDTAFINNLSRGQTEGLTKEQIEAICEAHASATDFKTANGNFFSELGANAGWLTTAFVGTMTATQFNMMTSVATQAMTATQLNSISSGVIRSLGTGSGLFFAEMSDSQVKSLDPKAFIQYMTADQLRATNASGHTICSLFSKSQFAGVAADTAFINNLSRGQTEGLTKEQIEAICEAHASATDFKTANGNFFSELGANAGWLTTAFVGTMTATQFNMMTSVATQAMTATQLNSISSGVIRSLGNFISGMTKKQVSSLTLQQISSLTQTQITIALSDGGLLWDGLSSEQRDSLRGEQLNSLSKRSQADFNQPFSSTGYFKESQPLFSADGPTIGDINQGVIGDCYFLAALAGIVLDDPAFIRSMIKDHGQGIYSVRFFKDGVAKWVTVDNLVAMGGVHSSNDGWVAIIEKAYVVFNHLYFNQTNDYAAINGGSFHGLKALTGHDISEYMASGRNFDGLGGWTEVALTAKTALQKGEIVMYSSQQNTVDANGTIELYSSHMFTVTGFNTQTGNFILRNPWGSKASNEQNWDTTFEESIAQLYGNGAPDTAGTFFIDHNSAGGTGSAGQLVQALAATAPPPGAGSFTPSIMPNQGALNSTTLTIVH